MISSKLFISALLNSKRNNTSNRFLSPKACKKFFRVNHVIFDLDGVVLDNLAVMDNAYKEMFRMYGKLYTAEWRFQILGMSQKAMWKKMIKEFKIKTPWIDMDAQYNQLIRPSLENAPVRRGVEKLIDHLEESGVLMALVTSSNQDIMKLKTAHIEPIMKKFSHVVCGDDRHVKKSKPAGDIYTVCAHRFYDKPSPEYCLVFDDTPNGVMAASCACMQVIGVPAPPVTCLGLIAFANESICTLEHFWPGKYGLPPFPEQVGRDPPPARF